MMGTRLAGDFAHAQGSSFNNTQEVGPRRQRRHWRRASTETFEAAFARPTDCRRCRRQRGRPLCRARRPPIAAGTYESTGQCAGVLAALEDRRSGDECGLVAVDMLHEAATASWQVVDQFGLVEPQAIEVDQV